MERTRNGSGIFLKERLDSASNRKSSHRLRWHSPGSWPPDRPRNSGSCQYLCTALRMLAVVPYLRILRRLRFSIAAARTLGSGSVASLLSVPAGVAGFVAVSLGALKARTPESHRVAGLPGLCLLMPARTS